VNVDDRCSMRSSGLRKPVGVSEIADRIGVHPPFLELAEPHRSLVCPCTWD
jgi:hypothetical protein